MKLMMIDPWGINNLSFYTNGLCEGLSKYLDLTLVTNYYYQNTTGADYKIYPLFFRVSEYMHDGLIRKGIRGVEYVKGYHEIIKLLKKDRFDIVHIQWLLQYKLDIYFLQIIKKYCSTIIYTAHNIVPHVNGSFYIDSLRRIYSIVDKIILHGSNLKKEFEDNFGDLVNKVVVQKHGIYLNQNTKYNINDIDKEIINKINKYDKKFIFFGNMFYNKGVDRLVKMWLKFLRKERHLLIIAGKNDSNYTELTALEAEIKRCNNILYLDYYVEENLLNFLISHSDVILLPYRHASMSGVIFTAAEFNKTILSTKTGAIPEYVIHKENSFVVENKDETFCQELLNISSKISKDALANMGIKLNKHIKSKCSWSCITKELFHDVYLN